MKKLLLKISYFILISIFIYSLTIFLLVKYDLQSYIENVPKSVTGGYGYSLLRFREAESVEKIDALFIGSSHSYRSFDPKLFEINGISTFNLGTSQQTPVNSYFLLKEYLPKMKPKVVFIEVFWRVLQIRDYGIESSLDIISNKKITWETFEMAHVSNNHMVYNAIVYQLFNRIFNPLNNAEQYDISLNNYKGKGFVESTKIINPEILAKQKDHAWTYKSHQFEYLKKCIELCKSYNTNIVLVMTPVTKEFLNSATNHYELFKKLRDFADEENVNLLNYNIYFHEKLNSKKHFYDPNHLNNKGVEIFNKKFIQDLKNYNYLTLPDQLSLSYNKNLLTNSNFLSGNGLIGWIVVGNKSSMKLTKNGLQLQSSGELSGLGQFVLEKGKSYTLEISIANISSGSLAIFNYNKKLFSIKKPGTYSYEFKAEYPSIYFYREAGKTDLTISNISVFENP